MAFIDRTVVKRLLIERLIAQLALDSGASGVSFLVASEPDPTDEADTKWCRVIRYACKGQRRQKTPDASGAERIKGAHVANFTLVLGVGCRVSAVEESDYAWDSAAAFVERAFDGASMVAPSSGAPVHVVEVTDTEAVQDATTGDGDVMFSGIVTVTGSVKRGTGDSLETRPAAV